MKKLFYTDSGNGEIVIFEANNQGSAFTNIQDSFYWLKREDVKELTTEPIVVTLENGNKVLIQAIETETIESLTKEIYYLQEQLSKFGGLHAPVNWMTELSNKKIKLELMKKPKIMCNFCYVEREYYDNTEMELAERFKFAEKLLKHKWYCPLFKFIYRWTGKKII